MVSPPRAELLARPDQAERPGKGAQRRVEDEPAQRHPGDAGREGKGVLIRFAGAARLPVVGSAASAHLVGTTMRRPGFELGRRSHVSRGGRLLAGAALGLLGIGFVLASPEPGVTEWAFSGVALVGLLDNKIHPIPDILCNCDRICHRTVIG